MSQILSKPWWWLLLIVLSILLHNLIYGLFRIEEPVFFLLTFIFGLGFLTSIILSVIKKVKKWRSGDV
jgi:hypothetical protein